MKSYHDPVTGDELSAGEHVSWMIQSVIRRWSFLITFSLLTLLAWALSLFLPGGGAILVWWNLIASYMAIVIESIVGLAMFNQTRRDAVIIREVRTLARQHEQALARMIDLEEKTEKQTEMFYELLKEQAEIKRRTGWLRS